MWVRLVMNADTPTLVDFATVSMSAPGMPRTVTDTVCVTDGRDLTCDRGVYVTPAGRVGIGIAAPIAPVHVMTGLDVLARFESTFPRLAATGI